MIQVFAKLVIPRKETEKLATKPYVIRINTKRDHRFSLDERSPKTTEKNSAE